MKLNKKLLDIFKKVKTTSDEYTYACSYINTELDKKSSYTKSNTDSNGWAKIDFGLYKIYVKKGQTNSINFASNGWGDSNLSNLPTDISSFNTSKHTLVGIANAGDNAIDINIKVPSTNATGIGFSWRNRYGGNVTAGVAYSLAIFVFE